ncbi:MAG: hypothetical protein IPI42_14640 [Saprospiraceae bacterium]|nr:hypothetical protein [Candidatus Parvibacillus calidus]
MASNVYCAVRITTQNYIRPGIHYRCRTSYDNFYISKTRTDALSCRPSEYIDALLQSGHSGDSAIRISYIGRPQAYTGPVSTICRWRVGGNRGGDGLICSNISFRSTAAFAPIVTHTVSWVEAQPAPDSVHIKP